MSEARVVELLGGRKAIGADVRRELDFHPVIRRGFNYKVVLQFKKNTALPKTVLAGLLGVSTRTLDRMDRKERLKESVSDRLYRTAKVFALAEEVFENRQQAREWLSSKQIGVGNKIPLDLLATDAGTREVIDELRRIEHGFLA